MDNPISDRNKPPRVLFFSGKGGVGKTTLAGTASVYLADKGDQVLVASTDPAHSLSDLFDQQIGGEAAKVADGVYAMEVDAPSTMDNMFDGLGSSGETGGMAAVAGLLKLASHSPGIDEIVSIELILRLIEQPVYDTVILDTAPTGHTLRLLALPELMNRYFGRLLKWQGQIARFSKRLKSIFQTGKALDAEELGDELAGARGRMRMLGELLRDPGRCSLVLVTIPEAMSVLETMRTLALLTEQNIPVAAVAVNMIQPFESDCRFCTRKRETQLAQLRRIRTLAGEVPIIPVEHEIDEPRGQGPLNGLSQKVWSDWDEVLLRPATPHN